MLYAEVEKLIGIAVTEDEAMTLVEDGDALGWCELRDALIDKIGYCYICDNQYSNEEHYVIVNRINPDGTYEPNDEVLYNNDVFVFTALKDNEGTLFKPAYSSYEELYNEMVERFSSKLPQDFDIAKHLSYVEYVVEDN